jgi:hypothetical protein
MYNSRTEPALFVAGFHDWDAGVVEQRFYELLVEPFETARRRYLARRFFQLLADFKKFGLTAEVWIDGSYVTEKQSPNDIDVVFIINPEEVERLPRSAKVRFRRFSDRAYIEDLYDCHLFVLRNDQDELKDYFEDWFGHSRSGEPKGLIRFFI